MKKIFILLLALISLFTLVIETSESAMAEHRSLRDWHGREHIWGHGNWFHGWYGGHFGWFWFVPGYGYYPYPAPIYPVPDPYAAPMVIELAPTNPAPVAVPPTGVPPQAVPENIWYYCDVSKTYYPYVKDCPSGWKTVPAKPQ
jgi:hypothetical protein